MNGVIPAADMIGPPLAGFLADKIGNFRVFMSGLTFASGAASLLLLLIPSKTTMASVSHSSLTCCTVQPDSWHCSSSSGSYMASPLSSPPPPLAPPLTSPHLICTDKEEEQVILALSNQLTNSSTLATEECFEVKRNESHLISHFISTSRCSRALGAPTCLARTGLTACGLTSLSGRSLTCSGPHLA